MNSGLQKIIWSNCFKNCNYHHNARFGEFNALVEDGAYDYQRTTSMSGRIFN